MLNDEVEVNKETFEKIEAVYLEFNKTLKELSQFENMCKQYDKYKYELQEQGVTREIAKVFETNWEYYYGIFRNRCQSICPNPQELANIAVRLCYEKYPKRNKKFLWRMAGRGVVMNLKQEEVLLPLEDPDGELRYLGRAFRLAPMIDESAFDPMGGGEQNVLHDLL